MKIIHGKCTAPFIVDINTRYRLVGTLMPWSIYTQDQHQIHSTTCTAERLPFHITYNKTWVQVYPFQKHYLLTWYVNNFMYRSKQYCAHHVTQ